MTSRRPRLLVFIVAYEAETTLQNVLDRIPDEVFASYDTEVLVIDDSSRDRTFEIGMRHSRSQPHRVTVLYNTVNQGYGGNQKLGYAYAMDHAFDVVLLLHGDGQYAPERIPDLVRPILAGEADAVIGSRMLIRGAARQGGMPLYKLVGNRVLTWIQNRLLGTQLSEFHSGYRAYGVATLARVPFQFNSDGFPFDTEIIIQLLLGGFRIREVPIPTYYGDEICRVDGLQYAADVVRVTVMSRLHAVNLFYDRKFDSQAQGNAFYDLKLDCTSSHTLALEAVAPGSRVLDIGCGPGAFARELKKRGCRVTGIDQHRPPDPQVFEGFHVWDGRLDLPLDLGQFDTVLMLDIIEHLTQPEEFLDVLRGAVGGGRRPPKLIVTSGNVGFCIVRGQLLFGNFNYGKRGILDLTHRRLYTFKTLRRLFEQCGYRVEQIRGVPAPLTKVLGATRLARFLVFVNELLIRIAKGLFSYQIFLVAMPLPTVRSLLARYTAESEEKARAVSTGPS